MIHCNIGTYDHCISIPYKGNLIDIDRCILKEMIYLWSKGVHTGGCCCGHGILPPSVAVYPESKNLMIELGYQEENNPNEVNCFILKTNTF